MFQQNWSRIVRYILFAQIIYLVSCSAHPNQSIVSYPTKLPPELSNYGLDADKGEIAWYHPPITIYNDNNQRIEYRQNYPSVVVRDFFVSADISWESDSQASGCGFSFRTHGPYENPSRYILYLSREPFVHIHFAAFSQGKLANLRDLYKFKIDPTFNWQNGTSNQIAVKVIGTSVTVYLNYAETGTLDITKPPTFRPNYPPPPDQNPDSAQYTDSELDALEQSYQDTISQISKKYRNLEVIFNLTRPIFYEGYVGFTSINSTGFTSCKFENAWLWHINQTLPGQR